jgi:SAM-dependent methyltransferase
MRYGSLIDDVCTGSRSVFGYPILFSNAQIRRMLKLAKVGKDDIFYDLGCGYGQNLIIALTEFNAKKVVGFESNKRRSRIARGRLEGWIEKRRDIGRERWEILPDDFQELLSGNIRNEVASLQEATVIFYGLETNGQMIKNIEKAWKNQPGKTRRLVYYRNCLFPEIMPTRVDVPFIVSEFPFKPTTDKIEWLTRVTCKQKSSLVKNGKLSLIELWDDLRHDYDIERSYDDISDYKRRLRRAVSKR